MDSNALTLIQTKFHKPRITTNLVERPRLVELLSSRMRRKLTLVSAPAGYGKSTLISAWLEHCQSASACISVDKNDNDLRTFLSYFVAAVQCAFPDCCPETQALLQETTGEPGAVHGTVASVNRHCYLSCHRRLGRHRDRGHDHRSLNAADYGYHSRIGHG